MKIKSKNISTREYGSIEWFITSKDNTENYIINCTKKELNSFLLSHNFKENTYEVFIYRSDEYWMYLLGDNYDVSVNYSKK